MRRVDRYVKALRYEFGHSIELSPAEAGTTVVRWLYAHHLRDLPERKIRLLCEIHIASKAPWNYTFEHTFPASPPNIY